MGGVPTLPLTARMLRVEYPGAVYHVMNRGDRREPILRDDEDRERFLATLGEACVRSGWQVHAYVLMPQDSAAGRRALEQQMEVRRGAEESTSYRTIRRGWFFGESALKQELLGQMSKRMGPEHYGEERQASQEEKAERVVAEELRRRKWTEGTLKERAKGDREKVKLAVRLRQETLVTVAWIAERLQMGSVANVHTLLYHWRQRKK